MDDKLKNICDRLIDNWKPLKKEFKHNNDRIVLAASTILLGSDLDPDYKILKACETHLDNKTGRFSEFQGAMKLPVLFKMSTKEAPGVFLEKVRLVNELLKSYKWLAEDYRVSASMIIADCVPDDITDESQIRYYLNEAGDIFGRLKDRYGKLVSDRDYPFAAMLASTDFEIEPLLEDVFDCENRSSDTFKDANARRAMAYVLAAGEEDGLEKRAKMIKIFQHLESADFKFTPGYELTFMAALASLGMDAEEIAKAFLKAEEYLRMDKHCRGYTMKPHIRAMYTALAVWLAYKDDYEESRNSFFCDSLITIILIDVSMLISASSFLKFS